MSTRGSHGRARRRHPRWHTYRLAWLLGGVLVCLGALSGAFGTVAWLAALGAESFGQVMMSLVGLGIAPVLAGGVMLWGGLSVLESQAARGRIQAISEERLLEAASGGATAEEIALRLSVSEHRDLVDRLDQLVVCERLSLEINEDGELIYAHGREGEN